MTETEAERDTRLEQLAKLREPFNDAQIGKLPRVTCPDCSDRQKTCSRHQKQKCGTCGAYVSTAHIHIDFVGHADLTDRLLTVDPMWWWEPVAFDADGLPAVRQRNNTLNMWVRLHVAGMCRLGVGTCSARKEDAEKELIGDALRNAAMRFGAALDLWSKSDKLESQFDDGGVREPPSTVSGDQVRELVGVFDQIEDLEARKSAKDTFVAHWGRPGELAPVNYGPALRAARELVKARLRPAGVTEDGEMRPESDRVVVETEAEAKRWLLPEVMARKPDGWSKDRFLEALLVKANAMRPDANKGAGFESWGDLKKYPAVIGELMAQVEAGTLEDTGQEAFLDA